MLDIVQEILLEMEEARQEKNFLPTITQRMALAAQRLYQDALGVCFRFGIPHTAIQVEVWSRGRATKRPTSQGVFRMQEGRFFHQTNRNPPMGPGVPFGFSWVELSERPEGIKSQKRKGDYLVRLHKWAEASADYLQSGSTSWKVKENPEIYYGLWRYERYKAISFTYEAVPGDFCDVCKRYLGTEPEDVYITPPQQMLCGLCVDNLHPIERKDLVAQYNKQAKLYSKLKAKKKDKLENWDNWKPTQAERGNV